jgi:hypothetical protein
MAMLCAPAGPYVATLLVGDRTANVAALRRLDSLVVLGPAWALATALVLS